jgi:hypothetical protein
MRVHEAKTQTSAMFQLKARHQDATARLNEEGARLANGRRPLRLLPPAHRPYAETSAGCPRQP